VSSAGGSTGAICAQAGTAIMQVINAQQTDFVGIADLPAAQVRPNWTPPPPNALLDCRHP
jgi:hypothetical protein